MLVVGVDEAGKGPVIGNMFIGFCIFKTDNLNTLEFDKYVSNLEIKDSKKLTPKKRNLILNEVLKLDKIKLEICKITPKEIDSKLNMYELEILKISKKLNEIKPDLILIDSLSSKPKNFENRLLEKLVFKPRIICENKADDKYKIVSIASIFAKEHREKHILKIKKNLSIDFGSGYTSDKKTIFTLEKNLENIEFLKYVRKSFKTYKNLKQKNIFDY